MRVSAVVREIISAATSPCQPSQWERVFVAGRGGRGGTGVAGNSRTSSRARADGHSPAHQGRDGRTRPGPAGLPHAQRPGRVSRCERAGSGAASDGEAADAGRADGCGRRPGGCARSSVDRISRTVLPMAGGWGVAADHKCCVARGIVPARGVGPGEGTAAVSTVTAAGVWPSHLQRHVEGGKQRHFSEN